MTFFLSPISKELYTDACSCVLADGICSKWFQVFFGLAVLTILGLGRCLCFVFHEG